MPAFRPLTVTPSVQSIQFLVDVSSFKHAVQAADIDDFHAFVSIVDEYIKDDSPSEINIDSCAKRNVPMHLSPREYVKLDKVSLVSESL